LEKAGKNVFDLINGEEVVGVGSGKPDPGRKCVGRSQNLKGGDFRGRRGLFHAPIFVSGCGMKTLGAIRVRRHSLFFSASFWGDSSLYGSAGKIRPAYKADLII